MKKYIIIGPARSGTTVTHLILKGHPQIATLNDEVKIMELFGKGISAYTFGNDLDVEINKGYSAAFDMLAMLNVDSETKAAGIKCAVGTIEAANIFVERIKISLPEVKIILTARKDLLAQYGSLKRARKTRQFHSWVISNINPPGRITVDKGMYSHYFLANMKIIEILRGLKQTNDFLEISYEKDILPGLDYSHKLYDFIGLDYIEPTWVDSKKVAPSPGDFIKNYDELKGDEKLISENKKPTLSLKYITHSFLKFIFHKALTLMYKVRASV